MLTTFYELAVLRWKPRQFFHPVSPPRRDANDQENKGTN